MILRNRIIVLSITALAIGACSGKKAVNSAQPNESMLSDRPINPTAEVFVVTLNEPALLTVASKTATGWQIPAAAKQKVLDEQAAFEKQLSTVAPEAKIIYRYRLTLNGLAVYAPPNLVPMLTGLPGVTRVEGTRQMSRPQSEIPEGPSPKVAEVTSVNFIGADKAHAKGITGKGMRVGILDTGIDYTHRMLGGSGNAADYKAIDPSRANPAFPNQKVVGGIDLVGTDYNSASPFAKGHLPVPDENPLDEAGHGTHVAGTVAGIGDDVLTYSGVAPDAQLYAIKVFGKDGSTADSVVIAGFEYAMDPNGDLNPDDQLDVLNLSLGGGFGQPQILYNEAVRNVTKAGTVIVASAGNSGDVSYIVGAPSTADEAFSIAASVDGSLHNWKFAAVRFVSPNNPNWLAKATEGTIGKPIADIGPVEGELYDIGFADSDLTDEQKTALAGKVALIQRGKVNFAEKLKRAADGGAIGAVVYNNDAGKPIPMGGDGKVDIPAIMVSQALGAKLKQEMAIGAVKIQFKTGETIEQPELVDTITDFSSRGPRSEDNLLKPEIAAPGARVISAAMGRGNGSVEMDGTSMAAPHMAGVMTLLKQEYPQLSADELKALAMNTAKPLVTGGVDVPLTLQGAGRVDVAKAADAPVLIQPPALNLGRVQVGAARTQTRQLTLRNLKNSDVVLQTEIKTVPGLAISVPSSVTVPAKGQVVIDVTTSFDLQQAEKFVVELNGRVSFKEGGVTVASLPALAIRTQASEVTVSGTPDSLTLSNASPVEGLAVPFNLIGEDMRKRDAKPNQMWKGRGCDLQSAGYRIRTKMSAMGPVEVLQIGFKLFSPVTTWHRCELSVLIDQDGDGVADQELASIAGAKGFGAALLDAAKARNIRLEYEKDIAMGKDVKPDYQPAFLGAGPMAAFPQSSFAMMEVPLSSLAKAADGSLRIKVAAQGGDDVIEADDYLGEGLGDWISIAGKEADQPYSGLDEVIGVGASGASAKYTKGANAGRLVLYMPINQIGAAGTDTQSYVFP